MNSEEATTPLPTQQEDVVVQASNLSRTAYKCRTCDTISLYPNGAGRAMSTCPECNGPLEEVAASQSTGADGGALRGLLAVLSRLRSFFHRAILGFAPLVLENSLEMMRYKNLDLPRVPNIQISAADVSNALQCSVCLEPYVVDEIVSKTQCGHMFHRYCINKWLELEHSCPNCRAPVDITSNPAPR